MPTSVEFGELPFLSTFASSLQISQSNVPPRLSSLLINSTDPNETLKEYDKVVLMLVTEGAQQPAK
jgi:hypothetical protein